MNMMMTRSFVSHFIWKMETQVVGKSP